MTKIIFATGNKDKLREIKEILSDCDVDIRSMKEAGINVDIVEDGKTFEDNALIKARAIAAHTDANCSRQTTQDLRLTILKQGT